MTTKIEQHITRWQAAAIAERIADLEIFFESAMSDWFAVIDQIEASREILQLAERRLELMR
jgi:hypothetical protein